MTPWLMSHSSKSRSCEMYSYCRLPRSKKYVGIFAYKWTSTSAVKHKIQGVSSHVDYFGWWASSRDVDIHFTAQCFQGPMPQNQRTRFTGEPQNRNTKEKGRAFFTKEIATRKECQKGSIRHKYQFLGFIAVPIRKLPCGKTLTRRSALAIGGASWTLTLSSIFSTRPRLEKAVLNVLFPDPAAPPPFFLRRLSY
jgi:hypothetical protein